MIIVAINDPVLEQQINDLASAHHQSAEEEVLEILNAAIFPQVEDEGEGDPPVEEPKPKKAKEVKAGG